MFDIKVTYLALVYSIISIVFALITAVLVIQYFDDKTLGLYFTINAILAFKSVLDAGYSNAIISTVAANRNDRSINFIFKHSTRRFLFVCVIGFISLIIFGYNFFNEYMSNNGLIYLFVLSSIICFNIYLIPHLAIIEGLDMLKKLYNFRIISYVLSYLISWTVLVLGYGLLNILVLHLVVLISTVFFIIKYFNIKNDIEFNDNDMDDLKRMFKKFSNKISLTWFCNFFIVNGIVPFVFKFFNPTIAGQLGLTKSLFSSASSLSRQFVIVKRPILGLIYSKNKFKKFFNTFLTAYYNSIISYISLIIIFSFIVFLINPFDFASKVLPYKSYIIYSILFLIVNLVAWANHFFRAQNKEIIYIPSVLVLLSIIITIIVSANSMSLFNLILYLIFFNLLFAMSYQIYKLNFFLNKNSISLLYTTTNYLKYIKQKIKYIIEFINYFIFCNVKSKNPFQKIINSDYIISSRNGLYALNNNKVLKLINGHYYGITIYDNCFYMYREFRLIKKGILFKISRSGIDLLNKDLPEGIHQIDYFEGFIYLTNTYNNSILKIDNKSGKIINEYYPIGKLSNGRKSINYGHINSILFKNNLVYLICHNETVKTKKNSDILICNTNFEVLKKINTNAKSAHNIIFINNKKIICNSIDSSLTDGKKDFLKLSNLTRGISFNGEFILIGESTFANRKNRDKTIGYINILGKNFELIEKIKVGSSVHEIRSIKKVDLSLSQNN